jgi:hypothetical protein
MTVEAAVYAGGVLLISFVLRQTHRANIGRFNEIQREVSGLSKLHSRLFLTLISGDARSEAAPRRLQYPDSPLRPPVTHRFAFILSVRNGWRPGSPSGASNNIDDWIDHAIRRAHRLRSRAIE